MLLSDAIDHYKADRTAKGYAKGTVTNEQSVLRNLLADIGNIQVSSITTSHMDKFWHKHQDWMPGTFNRAKAYLNGFFKWCRMRGHMARHFDPLEGVRDRKVPPRDWIQIPVERFPELLDAASSPRNRMIVAFGLYLFVRVSETSALRWQDVNFDEARRGTDEWRPTINVWREKTQTMDVLPMSEELDYELRKWRLEYGRLAGEVPKPGWYICPPFSIPQFTGRKGESGTLEMLKEPTILPTRRLVTVTPVIKQTLAAIGLDADHEGGHTLRRSGAQALYDLLIHRGHDGAIRMCQAMLGHSSVRTTEVYLRLDLARKSRNDLLAGKRMFPPGWDGKVVEMRAGLDGREDREAL